MAFEERPIWVTSRRYWLGPGASAIGWKADIRRSRRVRQSGQRGLLRLPRCNSLFSAAFQTGSETPLRGILEV